MAGDSISPPSAEVLLSRRVQELVVTGEDPPAPYVCRDDEDECEVAGDLVKDSPIPVIDMEKLCNHEESQDELEKLKLALSTWGCFQVHLFLTCFFEYITRLHSGRTRI